MRILGCEIKLPRFFSGERRRAPRYLVYEALYVSVKLRGRSSFDQGEALDISQTGIRLISNHKFPKGALLDMELRFTPGSTPQSSISVQASVVRCYKKAIWEKCYRMGCQFEALDPTAQEIIRVFISWLKEREEKYLFFRYQPKE